MRRLYLLTTLICTSLASPLIPLDQDPSGSDPGGEFSVTILTERVSWDEEQLCFPQSFVTGYALQRDSRGHLSYLSLTCSIPPDTDTLVRILNIGKENGSEVMQRKNSSSFAIGFGFQRWTDPDGAVLTGKYQFLFNNEDPVPAEFPPESSNKNAWEFQCPERFAIAGARLSTSSTFKNSSHPVPVEQPHNLDILCSPMCTKKSDTIWIAKNYGSIHLRYVIPLTDVDPPSRDRYLMTGSDVQHHFNRSEARIDPEAHVLPLRKKSQVLICEPLTECTFSQMLHDCGSAQYRSKYFVKSTQPVSSQLGSPGEMDQFSTIHPGEHWLVARNVSVVFPPGDAWGAAETCPEGKLVTGHQFKYQRRSEGSADLTDVRLRCSTFPMVEEEVKTGNDTSKIDFIHGTSESRGDWSSEVIKTGVWATGIRFASVVAKNEMRVFKVVLKLQIIYNEKQSGFVPIPLPAFRSELLELKCPDAHAVCGIQTRLDQQQATVTDIALKCCLQCIAPKEMLRPLITTIYGPGSIKALLTVGPVQGGKYLHNSGEVARNNVVKAFRSLGKSSLIDNFDWSKLSELEVTATANRSVLLSCPNEFVCKYSQLMGSCGTLRLATSIAIATEENYPDYHISEISSSH